MRIDENILHNPYSFRNTLGDDGEVVDRVAFMVGMTMRHELGISDPTPFNMRSTVTFSVLDSMVAILYCSKYKFETFSSVS